MTKQKQKIKLFYMEDFVTRYRSYIFFPNQPTFKSAFSASVDYVSTLKNIPIVHEFFCSDFNDQNRKIQAVFYGPEIEHILVYHQMVCELHKLSVKYKTWKKPT